MRRIFGGLALSAPFVAACQPQEWRSPVNYGGMQKQQLRRQQLQGIRSGANLGVQNPSVVGVNPGISGITRERGIGAPAR